MWPTLSIFLHFSLMFVSTNGDSGDGMRFVCPRASILNIDIQDSGCIHKGRFIDAAECLELCQQSFRGTEHENVTEAGCEDSEECKCRTPPLPSISEHLGLMIRLTDLEEVILRNLASDEQTIESEEVRCGYLDGFITSAECRRLCTNLARSRDGAQNLEFSCEKFSRCECEIIVGYSHVFENLDTLEAQHRNEEAREIERNAARNVRLWIEMHIELMDVLRSGVTLHI